MFGGRLLELELRLELELDGDAAPAAARLRCALPPGYPVTAAARVSVSVEGLRRTHQDELTLLLQRRADALLGEEAVVELAQELQDKIPGVVADLREFVMQNRAGGAAAEPQPQSSTVTALSSAEPRSTILFHIDHMNDSTTYIRKLKLWAEELDLGAILLYRMRTKAVNASSGGKSVTPKGRAEEIWVLLDGSLASTKEFLSRLRTQKVTAQDRHERKSTVVWDKNSCANKPFALSSPLRGPERRCTTRTGN